VTSPQRVYPSDDEVQVMVDSNPLAGAMTALTDQGPINLPAVYLRIDALSPGAQEGVAAVLSGNYAADERYKFLMPADTARALGEALLSAADRAERRYGDSGAG
jgi:hypothetical protein